MPKRHYQGKNMSIISVRFIFSLIYKNKIMKVEKVLKGSQKVKCVWHCKMHVNKCKWMSLSSSITMKDKRDSTSLSQLWSLFYVSKTTSALIVEVVDVDSDPGLGKQVTLYVLVLSGVQHMMYQNIHVLWITSFF